jgi:hypothetical protein
MRTTTKTDAVQPTRKAPTMGLSGSRPPDAAKMTMIGLVTAAMVWITRWNLSGSSRSGASLKMAFEDESAGGPMVGVSRYTVAEYLRWAAAVGKFARFSGSHAPTRC